MMPIIPNARDFIPPINTPCLDGEQGVFLNNILRFQVGGIANLHNLVG